MIRFLSIRDLAIVDEIEIEFSDGFNVLTGETGAGKSIIVGALGILVGGRASTDLVRTDCDKAVIQASFESSTGDETIIRREILARGRSRIFINDELASAAKLKKIGAELVDLHGQHEHQALLNPQTHIGLLDAYAGLESEVERVSNYFGQLRKAQTQLANAEANTAARKERTDFLKFQLAEIERVEPIPGEDDLLSAERDRLANAERLGTLSAKAYGNLYGDDDSVLTKLGSIWSQLDEIASIDLAFGPYQEVRENVNASLDDIARTLQTYAASIEVSSERLEQAETRLAELERLKRKHGGNLESVLERRKQLSDELNTLAESNDSYQALLADVQTAREHYLECSENLSNRRLRGADALAAGLEAELAELGIIDGEFAVRANPALNESRWSHTGIDSIEFFFSANPGEDPRPLARIISGGEAARVMLAIKTLATTDIAGKTLVFDEVDAGIGGFAADQVGDRLRNLGKRYQVLCVTHAPQLAVHAKTHFTVEKHVSSGRTYVQIHRLLSEHHRAVEVARLMTGSSGDAALASAVELLRSRQIGAGERRKRKGESAARGQGFQGNG